MRLAVLALVYLLALAAGNQGGCGRDGVGVGPPDIGVHEVDADAAPDAPLAEDASCPPPVQPCGVE